MNTMKTRGDAECVPDTVPGSTGTGATGMRQPRLTTRATSQSVGWQSIGAILALVVGLVIGWVPAAADVAAPVATPVATSEATTVATPSATVNAIVATPVAVRAASVAGVRSNAIVRGRGTGPSPCVPASPVEWQGSDAGWWSGSAPTPDCPAGIRLGISNQTAQNEVLRVGDVVRVNVAAFASAPTGTYGISAYIDFDTADYQLVAPDMTTVVPVGAGGVAVPPTIGGQAVTTKVNTYRTTSSGTFTLGEIDLDVGVTLPNSQSPSSVQPITLTNDTFVGAFFLRILRNEATSASSPASPTFRIGLRHSSAGGDRNSVVSGAGDNVGLNILGTWNSARPTVAQTNVSLVLATRAFSVARVGDVLPIDIKLR
ncbi:MAG: hypothetical protein KGS10_18405, partial [Chloroflexi bacterium]|nr:hypothetical protein [Chloroflexota bacterium]